MDASSSSSSSSSASNNMEMLSNDGTRNTASNDVSSMTIEFLRARLLSERSASKSARQQVQQLSQKLSELQARLDAEVEQRKRAQNSMERMLKYLQAKGLSAAECAESEMENLESIKEVDEEHGAVSEKDDESEKSITKHEVIDSPRGNHCKQDVQKSIKSLVDDFKLKGCHTEEPDHGTSLHSSEAEIYPNQTKHCCKTDEKLQPTETPDNRLCSAFKLKSMLHQIVKEIKTLPTDPTLTSQLQDWTDNVVHLCDCKSHHSLHDDRDKQMDPSHAEEGKDCSKTDGSLCCSMNEKLKDDVQMAAEIQPHTTSQGLTLQDACSNQGKKMMTAGVSEAQLHSKDMQHGTIPVLLHKSSEYMRGRWPYSVLEAQHSDESHHFVTGKHMHANMCTDRHKLRPPTTRKLSVGHHEMMPPCDFHMKQDMGYRRNLEMHHGYVYDSVDVWHQGRVIMSNNNTKGHNALMDDKNGRLGDILNALQEARQYVDDGRMEEDHRNVSRSFCAPQSLMPNASENFYMRGENHRRNPAQVQAPPIIHSPCSPKSDLDAAATPPLDRHEVFRRSRSVSSSTANFKSVDWKNLQPPTREVQLGNGITLYTD